MFSTPFNGNKQNQNKQNENLPASPFVRSFFQPSHGVENVHSNTITATNQTFSSQSLLQSDGNRLDGFNAVDMNSTQINATPVRKDVKSLYDTLESTPKSTNASLVGTPMSLGTPYQQLQSNGFSTSNQKSPYKFNIPFSSGHVQQEDQIDSFNQRRVTVFGFPIEKAEKVLRKLSQSSKSPMKQQDEEYQSQIVDYVIRDRWIHIEFSSEFYAQVALSRNGELMVDGYLIGISPYREYLDHIKSTASTPGSVQSIKFSDVLSGVDSKSPFKGNQFSSTPMQSVQKQKNVYQTPSFNIDDRYQASVVQQSSGKKVGWDDFLADREDITQGESRTVLSGSGQVKMKQVGKNYRGDEYFNQPDINSTSRPGSVQQNNPQSGSNGGGYGAQIGKILESVLGW